ncbi:MAG: NfeD family protein [Hungatella sp.]
MTSIYWLIAFVILIGIELATMALTTIWFAGGALIAFIVSLFGAEIEIQLAAFVLVSFVLLFFTRPLAAKYFNNHTIKTNTDSLIGRSAKITTQISNAEGTGAATVGGQEWTARALRESDIYQVGETVIIREIRGVKLMVSKEQEE